MTVNSVERIVAGGASGAIAALIDADGSAGHRHLRAMLCPKVPMRDLADALHLICMLHGRFPGLFEATSSREQASPVAEWLHGTAEAFGFERQWLTTLVAAAGPLPSTPGQAESEAAVTAQRHALDTLATSERTGCAIGAAAALALDWPSIRALLNRAGDRLGLENEASGLPAGVETLAILDAFATRMAVERAAMFGAQQFLAQQRGLWDLLEARASARDEADAISLGN